MRHLLPFLLLPTLCGVPALATEAAPLRSPEGGWPHHGVFGAYDKAALQRGFLVHKQVCSVCHSLNLVAYRNLAALGYSEDEIKILAAQKTVTGGPDDDGNMFQRPARPSDSFVPPFPNDNAARAANNGALPPDLSLMTKARPGGEDYVYSLLTGYDAAPPHDLKLYPGMSYNPWFPGGQVAMPPPLASDDLVAYGDGTKATREQMARDVTQFLAWAAEPHLEDRHRIGIRVMLYLLLMCGVLYIAKRRLWRRVH